MRTSIAKTALIRQLHILLILIIGGIGVQTITSCSSDGIGDGGGGEGITYTFGLEKITGSSFTMVDKWYDCLEDGTLREENRGYETSYSINGGTLSFGEAEFSGNQSSLTGTWNSSSLQRVRFEGRGSDGVGSWSYTFRGVSSVLKATISPNGSEPRFPRLED